ncbi:hypothetical protein [Demequina sp.]|uniref:hypothetical protein n=1 Tax=Demequina sp. TaxID=2050685 RepID=UPI0025CC6ED9|nr:hypothetical protein [Demequina sp.]
MMRRTLAAATAAAASLAVVAGCTPDVPTPATALPAQEAAAVVQSQIDRIVPATFDELAAADAELDSRLLGERVSGFARWVRVAEYRQRRAGDEMAIEEIPATMQAVYTSAEVTWPRVMVGVTTQPADATPVVAFWVQEAVESDYQLVNWAHMVPGATLPAMPGSTTGAAQLPLDTDALPVSPEQVVADYLDLLREGPSSDLADQFEPDTYRDRLFDNRKVLTETAKKGEGNYLDTIQPSMDNTFALQTADGGALVFAPIAITSTIAVKNGATVSLPSAYAPLVDGTVKDRVALQYHDFLVFHVPADPEAKPAVVAADHHLIRVTAE